MSEIGTRIKRYEAAHNFILPPHSCLFIRVDGKSFHTFTRSCDKPFDYKLIDAMVNATLDTAKQMSGFKLAYHQSDEATFMLTDFDTHQTQGWFGYELNKVVSISAATFTAAFNKHYGSTDAVFDSRAFVVPLDDAPNVFIWRQRDWERNSIQMLARAHFSHKECENKKVPQLHEMLHDKGVNWAKLDDKVKNGTFINRAYQESSNKLDYEYLRELFELELQAEEVRSESTIEGTNDPARATTPVAPNHTVDEIILELVRQGSMMPRGKTINADMLSEAKAALKQLIEEAVPDGSVDNMKKLGVDINEGWHGFNECRTQVLDNIKKLFS